MSEKKEIKTETLEEVVGGSGGSMLQFNCTCGRSWSRPATTGSNIDKCICGKSVKGVPFRA